MIDSRRCARNTAELGSTTSSTPPASGPRWTRCSTIVVAITLPSGCWNAPAMPHIRSRLPRGGHRFGRMGRFGSRVCRRSLCVVGQRVEDREVGLLLVRPGQLLLYPLPTAPTHLGTAIGVVDQVDDGTGEALDIVGLRVDGRRVGRDPGLPEVERH